MVNYNRMRSYNTHIGVQVTFTSLLFIQLSGLLSHYELTFVHIISIKLCCCLASLCRHMESKCAMCSNVPLILKSPYRLTLLP